MTFLGIMLEAYSPLGSPARPFKTDSDPIVMEDPVIKEIAEKLGVTVGQVSLLPLLPPLLPLS